MPASDDRQAVSKLSRFVIIRSMRWPLMCLPLILALFIVVPGMQAGWDSRIYAWLLLWGYIGGVRSVMSDRTIRMLPICRQGLGRVIWRAVPISPLMITGVMCGLCATFLVLEGVDHSKVISGFLLGLLQLFALLGILTAGPSLRGVFGRQANDPPEVRKRRVTVWLLILLELAAVAGWVSLGRVPMNFGPACALWLTLGLAGAMTSHRFSEGLLFRAGDKGIRKPKRTETDAMPIKAKVPTGPSWDYYFGMTILSFIIPVVGVAAAFRALEGRALGQGMVFFAFLIGGTTTSACLGWMGWRDLLRVWRMLPLSRAGLGRKIVRTCVARCVVPWIVTLLAVGAVEVLRGELSFRECIFCLGLSMLFQGALLPILPFAFRRYDDTPETKMLKVLTGIVMFALIMLLVVNSSEIETLIRNGFGTYGWPVLAAGLVALCAGTASSIRNTSRVLRRSDCYRRTAE